MTTEFKPGDRVRGATHVTYSPHRRIYEGVLRTRGTLTAAVDTDNEGLQYVYTETLQALDPYTPKVGDKVRVVHEGVVTSVDGNYFSLEGDGDFEYHDAPGTSMVVELLEKAPESFAAGTYVGPAVGRESVYVPLARTSDGKWLNVFHGGVTGYDDDYVRKTVAEGYRVVVHEPPTS